MSNAIITWLLTLQLQWPRSMCVKVVLRRLQVTSRTSVTRRVAIARPVRRAHSRRTESPATTAIDILETPRVSRITSSVHRPRNRCANVNGVARSVEGKRRPQNTNVTNVSVATVRRTKISDTCVTWDPCRTLYLPQAIRYCTYSMILRQPKIQSTRTSINYTYLISSVRSSSVRDAKTRKTETACDVVGGSTLSGKIPLGNCLYT